MLNVIMSPIVKLYIPACGICDQKVDWGVKGIACDSWCGIIDVYQYAVHIIQVQFIDASHQN